MANISNIAERVKSIEDRVYLARFEKIQFLLKSYIVYAYIINYAVEICANF